MWVQVKLTGEFTSEAKIQNDGGKLVREGKDVVDGLVHYCIDYHIEDLIGPILQAAGLSGEISSVHLIHPKTYVAVPQFKVNIPRSILHFDPFIDTPQYLITMIEQMGTTALLVENSYQFFEDRSLESTLIDAAVYSERGRLIR